MSVQVFLVSGASFELEYPYRSVVESLRDASVGEFQLPDNKGQVTIVAEYVCAIQELT